MIKKFIDFDETNEGVVNDFKKFFSRKKEEEEKIVRKPLPPMHEPSGEKKSPTFPCVYSFLTQELVGRKRANGQKHIGIRPDGYGMYCKTPKELEEAKSKYKVGDKYNGETIIVTDIGPERNY